MKNFNELKQKLTDLNQLHLLKYWNELTLNEQEDFLEHLISIDLDHAIEQYRKATNLNNNHGDNNNNKDIEPIPSTQIELEDNLSKEILNQYERLGLEAISRNEIGVLLMAGGQGTRLGVNYPKGILPINLPSKKTLLQIQAERIRRLEDLSQQKTGLNGKITWYIMTSESTDLPTKQYLDQHKYFGLNPDNVVLFKQGQLPCFDTVGRIILEKKNRCALSPDGNGGLYRALSKNLIIDDIIKRGIKYLHAYSVDNILIKVADPIFIGYCLSKNNTDCGVKAVLKLDPNEPIGVICKIKNQNCYKVVEYSEITNELRNQRDLISGNLMYNCGNICNHFFTTEFLKRIINHYEDKLKLHIARKKIPYYDDINDKTINPNNVNGIKIEKFIFDVFEFSENFVIWQVPRFKEFSPIKNSDESGLIDCPRTACQDLLKLHKFYIEQAGGFVENIVEISPLLSYAGENLIDIIYGKIFDTKCTILWGPNEVHTVDDNDKENS
uniref:UDP-N-acetylglucosamine diphosphorylase n=1 Tax=Mylabris sibirica TaxID=2921314 RepID=A0AAU0QPD5_9CUCU|nr:UAP [Mylabris sibirica]